MSVSNSKISSGAKRRRASPTHYLNVDLDIYSRRDLGPLVKAFGTNVNVLYVGRERGKYCAHLEISRHTTTADSTISAFCRLIEGLAAPRRKIWNNATVRSFSIGVQAGTQPKPCDFAIKPKTIKAVCGVAAQIVLTVYAAEQNGFKQAPFESRA
jgi:hypothetical protein